MMSSPLVTVYIPTHNRSDLLSRAVYSVINQTYKNIEIIICNDGSNDNTDSIITGIVNEHKNVKIIYIKNDISHGACFSRNRCIELARGDYITGLDDDDEFTPNRIELFVEYSLNNNVDFLTSSMIFFNGGYYKRDSSKKENISFDGMRYRNLIGNQVFARRDMFIDIGGFDESCPAWQDYDLWFRMVKLYGDCHRLSSSTYIMNVSGDRKRITTSSNAHRGYLYFIKKHNNDLLKPHLKSLYLQDIINRNAEMKISTFIGCVSLANLGQLVKYILRRKLKYFDSFLAKYRKIRHL